MESLPEEYSYTKASSEGCCIPLDVQNFSAEGSKEAIRKNF